MKKPLLVGIVGLCCIAFSMLNWTVELSPEQQAEKMKVIMREVGNQTLLANGDSTSLILPIKQLGKNLFQISFESQFEIAPESLPPIVEEVLRKGDIPEQYRVEVLECADQSVAYSYEMNPMIGESIIPCKGRVLPKSCYQIHLRLLDDSLKHNNPVAIWFLALGILILVFTIYAYPFEYLTSCVTAINSLSSSFSPKYLRFSL